MYKYRLKPADPNDLEYLEFRASDDMNALAQVDALSDLLDKFYTLEYHNEATGEWEVIA